MIESSIADQVADNFSRWPTVCGRLGLVIPLVLWPIIHILYQQGDRSGGAHGSEPLYYVGPHCAIAALMLSGLGLALSMVGWRNVETKIATSIWTICHFFLLWNHILECSVAYA